MKEFRRKFQFIFSKVGVSLVAIVSIVSLVLTATRPALAANSTIYSPYNVSSGYLNSRDTSGNLLHILGGGTYGGGINPDVAATTAPGEYCNFYNTTGNVVAQPNSDNLATVTGFGPSQPSDWQEGDASSGASNVCQSNGGTWGFKISGPNNCGPGVACGMHHFVKFSNDIRPWNGNTAPTTALNFSVTATAQTTSLNGGGATGYFCPVLQDEGVSPYRFVEYCFVEWRTGVNVPSAQLACANTNPQGNNIDTVWSNIGGGLPWGTARPGAGATDTFQTVPHTGNEYVTISEHNLLNAISLINTQAQQPNGCGRNDSTDVSKYRLIGFEDGLEAGSVTLVGGSDANENIWTSNDTLYPGETLAPNTSISDPTGTYWTTMQSDGNLVTYKNNCNVCSNCINGSVCVVWANGKYSPGAYLVMQADGNLVEYAQPNNVNPIWSTGTQGNNEAYITQQSDGNFVLYLGATHKWSSYYGFN